LDREQSEEKKGTLAFHTQVPNENKVEKKKIFTSIFCLTFSLLGSSSAAARRAK